MSQPRGEAQVETGSRWGWGWGPGKEGGGKGGCAQAIAPLGSWDLILLDTREAGWDTRLHHPTEDRGMFIHQLLQSRGEGCYQGH